MRVRGFENTRNLHSTFHSASDAVDDLEWVGKLSDPLLLNNNLLVRDMSCVVSNGHMRAHNRMGYNVEPFDIPHLMLPHLVLQDWITPLLLAKDMDNKIREGHNHIR